MFLGFRAAVAGVVSNLVGQNLIFSPLGQEKLQGLSKSVKEEISKLQSLPVSIPIEEPLKAEQAEKLAEKLEEKQAEKEEAIKILQLLKAFLDRLQTVNVDELTKLTSAEEPASASESSAPAANDTPAEMSELEKLVQDLILNRDIYWDVKNHLLHPSLQQVFNALRQLTSDDFSKTAMFPLSLMGGVEKIHIVGRILASLLPFYEMTKPLKNLNNHVYHPEVDPKILHTFREESFKLQDVFLGKIKDIENIEEKKKLLEEYKMEYAQRVNAFMEKILTLPGEDIFLDTDNKTFKQVSVKLFTFQGGVLRGLLQAEDSLNTDLKNRCGGLLEDTPPLTLVYDRVSAGLSPNVCDRRLELRHLIEAVIIKPFEVYITENGNASGLTLYKAQLLNHFLQDFIYADAKNSSGRGLFFNPSQPDSERQWRTADNFSRGELFTCSELATKLLIRLIDTMRAHDAECLRVHGGVGRAGELLAAAIEATTAYLAKNPYDHSMDDAFIRPLLEYKENRESLFPAMAKKKESEETSAVRRPGM